jgi:hypothetical protein
VIQESESKNPSMTEPFEPDKGNPKVQQDDGIV